MRSVNTQVKTNTTNEPIKMSVKFLKAIIDFWLDKKNRSLLYKDKFKHVTSTEKDNAGRKSKLHKVWKVYHEFKHLIVDFSRKETDAPGILDISN